MAVNNQLILAGALLLVLLCSYGVTFTEERPLKADGHKVDEAAGHQGANVVSSSRNTNLNRDVLEDNDANLPAASGHNVAAYDTDDFRPTTPGHSPGAGHSTGPASNDNN